ncbi:MAG TPA: hypothetical protein VM008_10790 [Phycisphaerae bacterium]|nr:hypothetical protein [Phycisphaerae bacterium]
MVGHVEIGIRYYGKTAAIGKEAVYTSFLVIAVPVVPTGCWYGVRSGNMCDHMTGRRIRFHFRSVLLGYLRWGAVVAPVAAFCYAAPNANHADWNLQYLVLSIIFAAMYLGLFFILVKASTRETRQRRLLHQVVQSTVNPDWLKAPDCQRVIDHLRPVLESLAIPLDARHWELREPDPELAPFVYAMARYMRPLEPHNDWDAVAQRIWSLMEGSGVAARLSAVPE